MGIVLQVETAFQLKGEATPPSGHDQPIRDLPLLERFRDLQRLSKRDRQGVGLKLLDALIAARSVESAFARSRRTA